MENNEESQLDKRVFAIMRNVACCFSDAQTILSLLSKVLFNSSGDCITISAVGNKKVNLLWTQFH